MTNPWTIIYYSHTDPIHSDHIRASNPDAQLILLDTSNDLSRVEAFGRGDYLLRKALKSKFSLIAHDNVLLVEWDVLITATLPDVPVRGLQAMTVATEESAPDWMWWSHFKRLPPALRTAKIGVVPFGFLAIERSSLQSILDPHFDALFELDIFSEVRFAAVSHFCGIGVRELDKSVFLPERLLRSTREDEVAAFEARYAGSYLTAPGFYHPVKHRVTK